jgi:hypothetical protein
LWEGTLEDGDLLYIPRGWWHVALPLAEPTLHLTVGIHNRTGLDLLRWLAERMRASETFRRDLPRMSSAQVRAEHAARMRDPGLVYEERGEVRTVRVDAVTRADELDGRYDLALIAVKAPLHRTALEPLVARDAADAYVSLGNGLIHNRLAQIVGRERLLACLVEWGGTNLGPGRLVRDTVAPMVVGELDGAERDRTRLLARCLEAVELVHAMERGERAPSPDCLAEVAAAPSG